MRTSASNIIANFTSKIWGFLSLYLFSRLYLSFTGAENFGIISYYALLFGIVGFVDVGISACITREFAKPNSNHYLKNLLHFFEKYYILICAGAAIVICLWAKFIVHFWLTDSKIPVNTLIHYVYLIAGGVTTQLMSSIYFGALMGMQKQIAANSIQIGLNVAKMVGGALILYYFPQELYRFFGWQIVCNILNVLLLRAVLLKNLHSKEASLSENFTGLSKEMWKYMGSMTLVSILSAIAIQSDKLTASKYLVPSDFGFYSLASTLSLLPVLITMPVSTAIFPVLVRSYSAQDYKKLYRVYEVVSFGILIIVLPLCFILGVYGEDIYKIWLSATNVSMAPSQIKYLIIFLSIGNTFQALQYLPFNLLMAKGKTKFTIYQAAAEVIFLIPALFFCVKHFGLVGIGIPWGIVKSIGFFYLLAVVSKIKIEKNYMNYNKLFLIPTASVVVTGLIISLFTYMLPPSLFTTVLSCVLILVLSVVVSVFTYDRRLLNITYIKNLINSR